MKQNYLKLLGLKVRDVITRIEGTVVSISFDVYGCVQGLVQQERNNKDGKFEAFWFDTKRLRPLAAKPTVAVPTFEIVPGGQKLPAFSEKPVR
jgi:hypothetical protein